MPLRFTHRILDHLAHSNYQPSTVAAMARHMGVAADDRPVFREAIEALREQGRLELDRARCVALPSCGDETVGVFRLKAGGFGFLKPDQPCREGELFVPRGATRDAISGDRVRVQVVHQAWRAKARTDRSPYTGRVLEVIERGREHFVGVLFERGGRWFVEPDGHAFHEAVLIRDPHTKARAKAGTKVVIEMLHYPGDRYVPEGVITKVLGAAGDPDVETQAVIEAHGLRIDFPEAAMRQARQAARRMKAGIDRAGREDLTKDLTFTIDPPDAKDFDDAISIERDADAGQWTLGVHIADVAHFVRAGAALDQEARERGNSVYLPRLVIPMLPEVLSNGVCSLQEGVPRLSKSVFITFDDRGQVVHERFADTVICSSKRLTYREAQALIDSDQEEARKHARAEPVYRDELIEALRLCAELAGVLQQRRHRDGMIVLQLPEVELVFDDDGHVVDAVPEDDAFTHTIIEMFMVEANDAVARTFDSLGVPIIRRVHPDPAHGDLAELRMHARAAGQRLPAEPTRHDLQRLLDATRNTPAVRAIHFAVLRTLAKASYSPALIGHFALASDHYAHFTSPIRRYPDLAVHRVLAAFVDATDNGRKVPGGKRRRELAQRLIADDRVLNEADLVELGRQCSETESEAAAAERELRAFLVLQFLEAHHLGAEFTGVVTGILSAGVFVSIERFLVEGLVRMQDMPQAEARSDRWVADERTGRLVAQRSGASLAIGDLVTVQILRVDLASRHLDLKLVGLPSKGGGVGRLSKPPKATPKAAQRAAPPKGKRKGYKQGRRGRRSRS